MATFKSKQASIDTMGSLKMDYLTGKGTWLHQPQSTREIFVKEPSKGEAGKNLPTKVSIKENILTINMMGKVS